MLRDITIGQHFPGHSVLHRCDPRLKLVGVIAYIIVLFLASNPLGITLSLGMLVLLYGVARIPLRLILKSLKPIVPIILFTAVLNLFFISGEGEPLVQIWVLRIYREGVNYAVLMATRVVALIAGTSLLTYTTSPIVLTDAIESLLRPLQKLRFPVHELAMMMTIALRFIPTLIDELPMAAVLAAFADGTTVIRDAAELKVKESDRIATVTANLRAMGCDVTPTDDGMIIRGGKSLHGAVLDSYLDHRVAMSFAVAGLAASGETRIRDANCVDISFPGFYDYFN